MRQLYKDLRRAIKILPYKPKKGLSEYDQSKKLELSQDNYLVSANFITKKLDFWENGLIKSKERLDSFDKMEDQKPIFDQMEKTKKLMKMISSFQMASSYLISQLISKINAQSQKIESLEAEIKRLKMYSDFSDTISNKFITHLSEKG
jgi:hypothetical protein